MAKKTFSSALEEARKYCRGGQAQECALLFLLRELEPQEAVWGEEYDSFVDFYTSEALTTRSRYAKFKKATQVFNRNGFERFGMSACILIADVPKSIRAKVLKDATAWHKEYQIPLSQARAISIISVHAPERAKRKTGVRQLRAHIAKLEATLASMGVKPPAMDHTNKARASAEFLRAKFVLQQYIGAKATDAELTKAAMKAAGVDNVKKKGKAA